MIDGEIVIADDTGHADFDAVQERLGVGRHADQVALRKPAVLLAFDLVGRAGEDLNGCPLRDRRANLAALRAANIPVYSSSARQW